MGVVRNDLIWIKLTSILVDAFLSPGSTRGGWGTWIRTKAVRVRAGSSTAKLSPIARERGASMALGVAQSTKPARPASLRRWAAQAAPSILLR